MAQPAQAPAMHPDILSEDYTDVPAGKLASIITYLEMRTPPAKSSITNEHGLRLRAVHQVNAKWYRQLFRSIGEDWLWSTRLRMSDQQLLLILHDPAISLFALEHQGKDCGLLELDRSRSPDVEIAFLGLTRDMIGKGAGRFLLAEALKMAWSYCPARVTLHTCTLDHPNALLFYRKAGFVPYKRAVRIFSDPRVAGALPRTAAPQIPIL